MGGQAAYGAQLDVTINPEVESSDFAVKYQKNIRIEYDEGGQVADMLRNDNWVIREAGDLSDPGVVALRDALNHRIASDGSVTQIDDLSVEYTATFDGRQENSVIDYDLKLRGTLTGYNIAAEGGVTGQKLVDLSWRGMTVEEPVFLNGREINMPISAIQANEPVLYSMMGGSTAESLLSNNLINADALRQPLPQWHFLFDPTGIGVDAAQFGISEELKGVRSSYTLGESGLREGIKTELEIDGTFDSDRTYTVKSTQSPAIGNLHILGFSSLDSLGELEIAGVTESAPEGGYGQTSTGDFPVTIIYGMAGLAAVGGGVFFIFSNRQLKKEQGQGQTGIDPSLLTSYQTSASAGGYQTNRGEAQLKTTTQYDQTRSVYADSSNSPPQEIQEESVQEITPPSPTTSEASCACAAAADSGNECDCEMQSQCYCDSTCGCNASVCRDTVHDMQ
ncbi:hypothetical protein CENSYa_1218 [Cenarchaeum symbiosum A]|uniref:Uncharacterized protein n=1 Tax=Cenarchaeum symbiosum (strain A) TaxID=414004 RepID=A0RWX5_CENSY|nr:hypothetical protein CENSYa_1218 [Cenarchaeum symbiosum A]